MLSWPKSYLIHWSSSHVSISLHESTTLSGAVLQRYTETPQWIWNKILVNSTWPNFISSYSYSFSHSVVHRVLEETLFSLTMAAAIQRTPSPSMTRRSTAATPWERGAGTERDLLGFQSPPITPCKVRPFQQTCYNPSNCYHWAGWRYIINLIEYSLITTCTL